MNARGIWKAAVDRYTLPSKRRSRWRVAAPGTLDRGTNTRFASDDARHAGVGQFMWLTILTPRQHVSDWS